MADVTYYFNAYTVGVWPDIANLIDGDTGTFAASEAKKTEQELTGNTCSAEDLGIITKVELRVYAYGDGDDRLDITPVFIGGDGDVHQTVPVVTPGAWGSYIDITADTNHPDWSAWSHIQDLNCIIDNFAVSKGNVMYASKVEIRVTYTLRLPTVTIQATSVIEENTATGNGNITATGNGTCDKRGIVYGTSTQSPPGDVAPGASGYDDFEEETDGFGTGPFTRSLTGLSPGTKYYARTYAHNSIGGYAYSDEIDFTTKPSPPTNLTAVLL